MIEDLRAMVVAEEFDYPLLMRCLQGYSKPRDRVTKWLKSGAITRVKKGLYVFGERYRRGPICLSSLANLIYGPSYISKEYALSFYNLIPERVELITSMTTQKTKIFSTPVGNFSYTHLSLAKYTPGICLKEIDEAHFCLIASPEKALADLLASHKSIASREELLEHLLENLRVDEEKLYKLHLPHLKIIAASYQNARVTWLYDIVGGKK
ncbi:MAG: hypothetical protein JSR46_12030 [Verrucomicrobia bacterium]|nr:hypothetical protein [Verrucomicrobiota bacterium]